MKEQSKNAICKIINENEKALIVSAEKGGVYIEIEYDKEQCKTIGIDSINIKRWIHPSADPFAASKLKDQINKWLREKHFDKFK